jgi:hypothetical protein
MTHVYPPSDFCFIWLVEDNISVTEGFMACFPGETRTKDEDITYVLYPTGLLVSTLFLLLTLFAYIVDPDLHRPLFGKITIGFVLNNLVAYLCMAVSYITKRFDNEKVKTGTIGCVVMGYFTLYTFTSFMFWINAMAANIFFKFSAIMTATNNNGWMKFVGYACYAQVPRRLTCAVYREDQSTGPE